MTNYEVVSPKICSLEIFIVTLSMCQRLGRYFLLHLIHCLLQFVGYNFDRNGGNCVLCWSWIELRQGILYSFAVQPSSFGPLAVLMLEINVFIMVLLRCFALKMLDFLKRGKTLLDEMP